MRVFLALLCLSFITLPALAQESIFLKDKNASKSDAQQLETLLGLDQQRAQSARKSRNHIVSYYYNECMKNPNLAPGERARSQLCYCAANTMKETMRTEDMQVLFEDNETGQKARYKFKHTVYGPCMEKPVRDLVATNCNKNPEMGGKMRNGGAVCECLGKNMGQYAAEKGSRLLDSNDYSETPYSIAVLFGNIHFGRTSERHLRSCIRTHEYGWR